MPDWKKQVRGRMAGLNLPRELKDEIIAELAAHLEDSELMHGADHLSQQVPDWRVLCNDIARAQSREVPMNIRTSTVWIPALATLLGASLCLALLQLVGIRPRMWWTGDMALTFYWPWLASLPWFGALGARLSHRRGATTRRTIASALAPALAMLITLCVILPVGLLIDGYSSIRLAHFAFALANWVGVPGLALLCGALPYLRASQRGSVNKLSP
ncbi:MAG TPA: hypothetical protein VFA67_17315 [Candidatus Sulfotelmatobacter sp.]|nr:hypothetical protein [Candidatus Sulfotelmatobacter sp.]